MIRFKEAAAAAVPTPPNGYATLFVDAATGLPAAKDSSGAVISLKGADGAGGESGTWVNLLAPEGALHDADGNVAAGPVAGDIPDAGVPATVLLEGVRADLADHYADRVRLTMTITVDDFNTAGGGM